MNAFSVAITTVRISDDASRKLDQLQARLRLKTGRRVTKQSIIEGLVERALEEEEPVILLKAPKYPLPKKIQKMILEAPFDWGVETREEDIDRLLYGEGE